MFIGRLFDLKEFITKGRTFSESWQCHIVITELPQVFNGLIFLLLILFYHQNSFYCYIEESTLSYQQTTYCFLTNDINGIAQPLELLIPQEY